MNDLLFDLDLPAQSEKAKQAENSAQNKLAPRSPFKSRRAYSDAFRRELRRMGYKTTRARYDEAGYCTTCGECGRCPGHHVAKGE